MDISSLYDVSKEEFQALLRLEPLKLVEGLLQVHCIPQHRHSRASQERFQTVPVPNQRDSMFRTERLLASPGGHTLLLSFSRATHPSSDACLPPCTGNRASVLVET